MKKRRVAAFLLLAMALSLLPGAAWAAEEPGSSPEHPLAVGAEALDIEGDVANGVSEKWLDEHGATRENPIYLEITLPDAVENIADHAFQQTAENRYILIGFTFPYYFNENIGAYAFYGCTSLQYIKRDAYPYEHPNVKFVLPGNLWKIGEYAFYDCFAEDVSTAVSIAGTTTAIGDYAFGNSEGRPVTISQIYVAGSVSEDYTAHCFSFHGDADDRMIIFSSSTQYNNFMGTGWSWDPLPNYPTEDRAVATYPITIRFGTTGQSERKLLNYSLLYQDETLGSNHYWLLNPDYELPEPPNPSEVPGTGYAYGWIAGGEVLTETSAITQSMGIHNGLLTLTAGTVLLKPEITVMVDGKPAVSTGSGTHYKVEVTLTEGEEHSVGLQISHPLLGAEGESVSFRYRWWDEQNSSPYGERTEEEGFSDAEPARTEAEIEGTTVTGTAVEGMTAETASIPITSTDHTRTDGNYYMVEVFGYHNKGGGSELYYKSHRNFISFITDEDVLATVPTVYIIEVTAKEAPVYTIEAGPAELDFGSVQTGYTRPAAQTVTITNTGNQSVTITLPALNGYTITAGDGWSNGTITLAPNAAATCTVQPNAGLAVGSYSGTLTINGSNGAETTVNLTFTVQSGGSGTTRYTITASAGEGGAISPSGGVRVIRGGGQAFAITPDGGYEIADVLVDGESIGAVNSYTFENVRANHTIEAVFAPDDGVAGPDETGVSDWLNTRDHMAYLIGYPGGAFGPDRNMTRAEAAQMFYNLLLDQDVPITVVFADVDGGAWYAEAVHTLASLGIIHGVGEGRFEPERAITRAEFTAIAMGFAHLETGGENIFSDVHEDDWFYGVVVGSIRYGWINGYPDGTFRPYANITRAEVAAIVNRMLGRAADTAYVDSHGSSLRQFADLERAHWAYYDIVEAANGHTYRRPGGTEHWMGLTET